MPLISCNPHEAPEEGLLRVLIINQNHHGRGLVLSRSCQVRKSEFLLYQYPESASLKLHGQFRNDDSHAANSIAVPDPAWWDDYFDYTAYIDSINPESVSNRVHQESRIALASVSPEIPCAKEVGTDSIAAFQTASQLSGFCQQSLGFNSAANFDNNLEQEALSACPDGANSKDSLLIVQSDWNETFCQESQEKSKIQISILNPFKCPHCFNPFSSEQRLRYVLLLQCSWIVCLELQTPRSKIPRAYPASKYM